MTSTALVRRSQPLPVPFRQRAATALRAFSALFRAFPINNDYNHNGWSIIRGTQPATFQHEGSEVRKIGWERHPIVNACARAVVELIRAIPFEVYRKRADGTAVVLHSHPALDLLTNPRPNLSSGRLIGRAALHYFIYGNAFLLLERKGKRGPPRTLRVIPPEDVQYVWLDQATDMVTAYDWRDLQGTTHSREPVENIVHVRDIDATDGLFGFPRLASALRSIAADSEASEYVRQVVTNHGTPGIAVMVDGSPSPEELESGRQRWQERWVTRGNRGGAAFMAGVKELKAIGFDLSQLEFPDLRRVTREDICSAANVDPRIIGVSSATSDAGLSGVQFREARHRLIQQTVYPIMRAFEDELNHWLMPEYGEALVRFSEEYIAAITEDVTATSTRILSEVAAKVISVEEAREHIGYDAELDPTHHYPGGLEIGAAAENAQAMADAVLVAAENPPAIEAPGDSKSNGVAASSNGKKPMEKAEPASSNGNGTRVALVRSTADLFLTSQGAQSSADLWRAFDDRARKREPAFEAAALALFNAERLDVLAVLLTVQEDRFVAESVRRILADYAPGGSYHAAWLERYTSLISQTVRVGGQQLAAEVGLSFNLENPRTVQIIRQRAGALVSQVTETTRDAIRAAVEAGRVQGLGVNQIAKLIEDTTFGEISKARAKVIARTETIGALNAGAYEAARQSNVMQSKAWLTQGDDRVRDSHADINGDRVPMDAVFGNGLPFPHAPGAPASEVVNCRCSLLYFDEVAPR